uniref:Uncharacterized protein n=1 Tax=Panagrellus redivivus TaxID=6233 RepID=A0A7E4UXR1_PANRE
MGLVQINFDSGVSKWNLAYDDGNWAFWVRKFRDGLRIFMIVVIGVHFIGLAGYLYVKERTIHLHRVSIDGSHLIESVVYFLGILGLMLLRIGVSSCFIQTTACSVRKQLLYQCTHCRSSPPTIMTSVVPTFREPPRSILTNAPKQITVPTPAPPIPEQNKDFLTVPTRAVRAVRFQDSIQQIG